jgi:hypothetical protein
MTLQDLGSIGALVATVATLLTLVYPAAQIRQNTRSVRTSAFQNAMRELVETIDVLHRDSDLGRLWFAGARDFDSLAQDERRRLALYLTATMRRYENLLDQARSWIRMGRSSKAYGNPFGSRLLNRA